MISDCSTRPPARSALVGAVALLPWAAPAAAAGDNIQLFPDPGLMLVLVVMFSLLVFPLDRLLFRPILAVLDARQEKTAGTRAKAEKLEHETQDVLDRYERQVAEVRADSERQRRDALAQARGDSQQETGSARAEAERTLEQAREEIAEGLGEARALLRGQAQELAAAAASRVLGRPLS